MILRGLLGRKLLMLELLGEFRLNSSIYSFFWLMILCLCIGFCIRVDCTRREGGEEMYGVYD